MRIQNRFVDAGKQPEQFCVHLLNEEESDQDALKFYICLRGTVVSESGDSVHRF